MLRSNRIKDKSSAFPDNLHFAQFFLKIDLFGWMVFQGKINKNSEHKPGGKKCVKPIIEN
jgi:hypothetical protein